MQRRDIIGWSIWIGFIIILIVFGVTHLQFSWPNSFVIFLLLMTFFLVIALPWIHNKWNGDGEP